MHVHYSHIFLGAGCFAAGLAEGFFAAVFLASGFGGGGWAFNLLSLTAGGYGTTLTLGFLGFGGAPGVAAGGATVPLELALPLPLSLGVGLDSPLAVLGLASGLVGGFSEGAGLAAGLADGFAGDFLAAVLGDAGGLAERDDDLGVLGLVVVAVVEDLPRADSGDEVLVVPLALLGVLAGAFLAVAGEFVEAVDSGVVVVVVAVVLDELVGAGSVVAALSVVGEVVGLGSVGGVADVVEVDVVVVFLELAGDFREELAVSLGDAGGLAASLGDEDILGDSGEDLATAGFLDARGDDAGDEADLGSLGDDAGRVDVDERASLGDPTFLSSVSSCFFWVLAFIHPPLSFAAYSK